MFRHLLVPTDGSPLSLRAAKAAVRFARANDARIAGLSRRYFLRGCRLFRPLAVQEFPRYLNTTRPRLSARLLIIARKHSVERQRDLEHPRGTILPGHPAAFHLCAPRCLAPRNAAVRCQLGHKRLSGRPYR